jgi:hypothetical protein
MSESKSEDDIVSTIKGKIKDQAISSALSFAAEVSNKLAFELPAPFGPDIAQAIGFIFGLASGGGDNTGAIQAMLDQAVKSLEDFMTSLNLEDKAEDVTSFLTWVQDNIGDRQTGGASNDELLPLLTELEGGTKGFHPGTLFSDLVHVTSSNKYIQADQWIDRENDKALSFVMTSLSARFIGQKLISLLSSHIAANIFHEGLYTVENDKEYQAYLARSNKAIYDMFNLLRSPVNVPPPGTTLEGLATEMRRLVDAQTWQPGRWARLPSIDDLYARSAAPFTTMNGFASQYGWAIAIERLILLRQLNALRSVTLISPENDPGLEFKFWDNGTSFYFSDRDYNAALQNWKIYLQQRLAELNSDYAADMEVVRNWQQRLSEMSRLLPPQAPPEDPVKDLIPDPGGWSHDPPPGESLWTTALKVRYAFSYENANGIGVRAWSDWFDVRGRWKPTLRQLPRTMEDPSLRNLHVWRQFLLPKTGSNQDEFDLPMIVGSIKPVWVEVGHPAHSAYTDNDPALHPPATERTAGSNASSSAGSVH